MPVQQPRPTVHKEDAQPAEEESSPQVTKPAQDDPQIGQLVHYVLDDGTHHGAHRPALVVSVEEPQESTDETEALERRANLIVFTDATNDFARPHVGAMGILWKPEVRRDEITKYPNSYHSAEV